MSHSYKYLQYSYILTRATKTSHDNSSISFKKAQENSHFANTTSTGISLFLGTYFTTYNKILRLSTLWVSAMVTETLHKKC